MTSINVNLSPCTHIACLREKRVGDAHALGCQGAPVRIACALPTSFTCDVVLGRCECDARFRGVTGFGVSAPQGPHSALCPANTVHVVASITSPDGSWERSDVGTCEQLGIEAGDQREGSIGGVEFATPEIAARATAAVCARWKLVKAAVTGGDWDGARGTLTVFRRRDAVYAALVEKARAEKRDFEADVALFDALKACDPERANVVGPASYAMAWEDPGDAAANHNSRAGLAAYVAMLIEQVGAMG